MRKLLSGLFLAAWAHASWAQVPGTYENDGFIQCPPMIPPAVDATNFVNYGQFIINYTNSASFNEPPVAVQPYATQDTLNYTNRFTGFMSCNTGFRLDTYTPFDLQRPRSALPSSFFNAGTVACGTATSANTVFTGNGTVIFIGSISGAKCLISATNIVNPGLIDMGFESLLNLNGSIVDLARHLDDGDHRLHLPQQRHLLQWRLPRRLLGIGFKHAHPDS